MTEPVGVFPNALPVRLWRTRTEPAAVTVRCTRGSKRCGDRLAFIYETDETAVVVFFQHQPDYPARISGDVGPESVRDDDRFKRWDSRSDRALMRGQHDTAGTVVCLERDDYWHDIVNVECQHHPGSRHLARATLMAALWQVRGSGRSVEISAP